MPSPASSTFGMEDSQFGPEINYSIPGRSTSSTPNDRHPPILYPCYAFDAFDSPLRTIVSR